MDVFADGLGGVLVPELAPAPELVPGLALEPELEPEPEP